MPARTSRRGAPKRSIARSKQHARIQAHGPSAALPLGYATTLAEIKQRLQASRLKAVMGANAALVLAYWEIGRVILARQRDEGWGTRVIDRLSADLRQAFPEMRGLSPRNLVYMRTFAASWRRPSIAQQLAARLPWFHHCLLLDRVEEQRDREWYACKAIENGWSRNVLAMQITSGIHRRQGKALTNFSATLSPADSDLAAQVFKDPYLFDFLGTADTRTEREIERGLVDHIQQFLLELGAGFAFVGRQVLLEVGDQDFQLDLLFYHFKLRRFVVIELKARPFEPAFTGQMNLYLSAVDDLLRHPDDQPTIGLLLCRERNQLVVEYALRDVRKPMSVAQWETRLVESLPTELEGSLPAVADIERELSRRKRAIGDAPAPSPASPPRTPAPARAGAPRGAPRTSH